MEGRTFTTVPFKSSSTETSVTIDVSTSVRKKLPVFPLNDDHPVVFWPSIFTADDWLLFRSTIVNPTAGSATSSAFFPGISVIENGCAPPDGGSMRLKSWESAPLLSTSHTAMKPLLRLSPLTDASNCLPSSLKRTWLPEPSSPVPGLVWLRSRERSELSIGLRPLFLSTVKQLVDHA